MFPTKRDEAASAWPVASLIRGFGPCSFYGSRSKYTVALSGDEVIAAMGIDAISLIKIDVDGGELEVIKRL